MLTCRQSRTRIVVNIFFAYTFFFHHGFEKGERVLGPSLLRWKSTERANLSKRLFLHERKRNRFMLLWIQRNLKKSEWIRVENMLIPFQYAYSTIWPVGVSCWVLFEAWIEFTMLKVNRSDDSWNERIRFKYVFCIMDVLVYEEWKFLFS